MSFEASKKNWEGLAQRDAYWAVCTHTDKKGNKWAQEDFYQSGKREIALVMQKLQTLETLPVDSHKALDFGCGLGRLSRALSAHFEQVHGVDVSPTMVEKAQALHQDPQYSGITFHHNPHSDLRLFDTASFSFVYTTIVLQHIPYPASITYIKEFLRMLKPGGMLVFQIPVEDVRQLSLIQKVKTWLRIRERLALIGIGDGFNMEMNPVAEVEIQALIREHQGDLLHTLYTNHTDPNFDGEILFMDRADSVDYVSPLFVVRKK